MFQNVIMPLIGPFLMSRYPSKNPVKSRVSETVFRRYLSEYSDNKPFLCKNVHVNSLFIFALMFILQQPP